MRTARRLLGKNQRILVRLDSAFYGRGAIHAALAGGAEVSVTVRMDKAVKKAIAAIASTVATSARRITLHLPRAWPWETAWTALFDRGNDPPPVLAT